MLANRPNKKDKWEFDEKEKSAPIFRAGTLVVLPTVAIRQWQSEIARFTREGALSVRLYHGSDRNSSLEDLSSVDIVITSYKVSCAIFSKQMT
jgi:DNA repair protein RAD16